MEERYRLILSTIFNAIGCRVEVEKMIATGRIDMVVELSLIHIYTHKDRICFGNGNRFC